MSQIFGGGGHCVKHISVWWFVYKNINIYIYNCRSQIINLRDQCYIPREILLLWKNYVANCDGKIFFIIIYNIIKTNNIMAFRHDLKHPKLVQYLCHRFSLRKTHKVHKYLRAFHTSSSS